MYYVTSIYLRLKKFKHFLMNFLENCKKNLGKRVQWFPPNGSHRNSRYVHRTLSKI